MMRKKMAKIVEAKSIFSQIEGAGVGGGHAQSEADELETISAISIYLEMMDLIDTCLQGYRDRYQEMKEVELV